MPANQIPGIPVVVVKSNCSKALGALLLSGWTLLTESCEQCKASFKGGRVVVDEVLLTSVFAPGASDEEPQHHGPLLCQLRGHSACWSLHGRRHVACQGEGSRRATTGTERTFRSSGWRSFARRWCS